MRILEFSQFIKEASTENLSWNSESVKISHIEMFYEICRYFHQNLSPILDETEFGALKVVSDFILFNDDNFTVETIYGIANFDEDSADGIFSGESYDIDLKDLKIDKMIGREFPFFTTQECYINLIITIDDCYLSIFGESDHSPFLIYSMDENYFLDED